MTILDTRNHADVDTEPFRRFSKRPRPRTDNFNVSIGEFRPVVKHDMLSLGHDLKVLPSVVGLVAVDVMDDFGAEQWPAKMFLSHQPVFRDITARIGVGMVGALNHDVPPAECAPALPAWMTGPVCAKSSVPADHRAEPLTRSTNGFAADLTGGCRLQGHSVLLTLDVVPPAAPSSAGVPRANYTAKGNGWTKFTQRVRVLQRERARRS